MKVSTQLLILFGMMMAVFTAFGITDHIPWNQIEPAMSANVGIYELPIVILLVFGMIYAGFKIVDRLMR
jgi:hypothetical protein